MIPSVPDSQAEEIDYLATKVMGWTKGKVRTRLQKTEWDGRKHVPAHKVECWVIAEDEYVFDFEPTADWNHWRQVELKVMEDTNLLNAYVHNLLVMQGSYGIDEKMVVSATSILADLPTRVASLISAHKQLYGSH